MKLLSVLLLLVSVAAAAPAQQSAPPVQIAIYGLVHDHARGMIPRFTGRSDVQLAGIVEPNAELVARYAREYHLDPALFFPTLEALLAKKKVQAVSIFTSTHDHRRVVELCAPLGLDVMMEKPLATTSEDARAIAAAARKGGIHLIVNYETTWYPSVQSAYGVIHGENKIGDLRKIVVHDGHEGPAVIGCSPYFMAWLTDPVLDGGGALMDFGCYGADLVTWLMKGERPTSVFAVTQHLQPDVYPKVDDEATIVITYPRTQAILQASWNWPYGRKDMEIYGRKGELRLPNKDLLLLRPGEAAEVALPVPALKDPLADPLSYLAAVVRGEVQPSGLSGIDVNLVAMEILDAARESARTGKRIDFTRDLPK
jgi:predicted dehydrogenase